MLTSGCGSDTGGDAAITPNDAGILRRGNGGDPETLDPSRAESIHAFNVLRDLYEGLVTEGPDGTLMPGAASAWEVSADGRVYTFHLRDKVKWSNGMPVTAGEFVASFRRTLAPESQSAYAFLLDPIKNSAAVASGRMPPAELGVRAVDRLTLQIELAAPAGYFPGILAMPIAFPLFGEEAFDPRQFGDPSSFVGNGPYVLRSRDPDARIRLERNPRFRESGQVQMRFVDYYPIADAQAEFSMYRAGELDITATVPPAQIANLRRTRADELRISPSLGLYYIAFDLKEPRLDDRRLRQALSMAIDRETLADIVGRGEQAAYGIVPDGVMRYRPARYAWQSVSRQARESRARALYKDAGFGDASALALTLMYDAGDIHETVALTVTAMWRDVLGVETHLDKREWKYFLDTRSNREDWQLMRFVWIGDYNDANTFLDIFRSGSTQNLPGYNDREYDELLAAAAATLDETARAALLQQAEMRVLGAYPIVPLYFFVNKHLVKPSVRNFRSNVLDVHQSRYLELTSIVQ